MSSSRLHWTRTGARTAWEISAASTAKSHLDLRPNPPPSSVGWTVTAASGRPSAAATVWRVP